MRNGRAFSEQTFCRLPSIIINCTNVYSSYSIIFGITYREIFFKTLVLKSITFTQ